MSQRNFLSIAVIAAALLSGCSGNSNTPSHKTKELITFKGIPLGKPGSWGALQKLCLEDGRNKDCSLDNGFLGNEGKAYVILASYGNMDLIGIFSLTSNSALDQVMATSSKQNILALAEILEVKYGKSEEIRSTVENGMGTKFEKETFVWVDDQRNRIIIDSMYQKTDEGRILIQSAEQVAAGDRMEERLKKAAKSNL